MLVFHVLKVNHERENFILNGTTGIYCFKQGMFFPSIFHSLRPTSPYVDTDAPIITRTAKGDKVIINRQVVDTVSIGITCAVIFSSLCNGNVTITVLPWHCTAACNNKPIGFSLICLALLVSLITVITFGVINGLYLLGVSTPSHIQLSGKQKPLLQHLILNQSCC
ncbi:hypothetical protein K435DRAFT_877303 [Dendrothele bispora CBS 962.96]|uniref:Uncharacterized protein n=1 Tax=Dendrothele bispora (strain CBS 962.96) TaxID=1314807 RepID=A0A4S8KQJ5_DENBC|nr:hypothetical protein K435DRAFT_877303 [Dendrothele bispora CBS 962.96]